MLTKVFFDYYRKDLDFIIDTAVPDSKARARLKKYMLEDETFRDGLIGSREVLKKVTSNKEVLLKISPRLFFEIILRNAKREFKKRTWAIERIGSLKIPVFDLSKASNFLGSSNLEYLANMLSSFTKIESFTFSVRVRRGIWHKIKFNEMDIESLKKMSEAESGDLKFYCYKKIGDLSLFVLGLFPEYVFFDYRYPSNKNLSSGVTGKFKKTAQEYESEAKTYYKKAAETEKACRLEMAEVLEEMGRNFNTAKRVLDFVAQHYLYMVKNEFFDL